MKHFKKWKLMGTAVLMLAGFGCQQKPVQEKKTPEVVKETVATTLYDKSLPEIKKYVDGKWELISGQNETQLCEFENTFIVFDDDTYSWIEDGKEEPGDLNWRKEPTAAGYDAYLMDVFYATNPSYPLSIDGDTLYLQDCSQTKYKYKLVRK